MSCANKEAARATLSACALEDNMIAHKRVSSACASLEKTFGFGALSPNAELIDQNNSGRKDAEKRRPVWLTMEEAD